MFTRNQEEPQQQLPQPVPVARKSSARMQYKAIAARPPPPPAPAAPTAEQPAVSAAQGGSQLPVPVAGEQSAADLTSLFSLDADDSLIQELLAGIPATAWLPTDPLTSEDWFPDPSSSIITHDNPQPATSAYAASDPAGPAAAGQAGGEQTLDAAASSHPSATTPDARLLASVRAQRETPLISRHSARRGNPLHGFAKKHGIGYAVGNQTALLSPELLSSSPPKARQLRQNPYKYYSPPKHLLPRASKGKRGRNLQLGAQPPHLRSEQPQAADSRAARASAKWEIAQDKRLLRGVRLRRWKDGAAAAARDPSRFGGEDWGSIAEGVNAGGGVFRSARQCRRRWAVMHAHLGATIMDFVDCTPTPQSSAHSTPAAPGGLTPRTVAAAAGGDRAAVPRHVRNLQLAALPKSSPPLAPRLPESDASTGDAAQPQLPSSSPQLPPAGATVDLQSLSMERRWETPAYCQLLADIVQALTSPDSQAAAVVRRHLADSRPKPPANAAPARATPTSTGGKSAGKAAAAGQSARAPVRPQPQPRIQPRAGQATGVRVPSGSLPQPSTLPALAARPAVGADPPVASAPTPAAGAASAAPALAAQPVPDLGSIDQDMNMYLEFIQSLAKDKIDLNSAWTSLFDNGGSTALPLQPGAAAPS
ncbi:hypothetical protein IWW55_001127, partial [Coemansia sp. RSA 2706]